MLPVTLMLRLLESCRAQRERRRNVPRSEVINLELFQYENDLFFENQISIAANF